MTTEEHAYISKMLSKAIAAQQKLATKPEWSLEVKLVMQRAKRELESLAHRHRRNYYELVSVDGENK